MASVDRAKPDSRISLMTRPASSPAMPIEAHRKDAALRHKFFEWPRSFLHFPSTANPGIVQPKVTHRIALESVCPEPA
ncbi:hypothetical protein [Methylobacterium sp. 77]|uniref:hypothetical protein n=1 Tax=Methylobacterium sp. 77 TaxID=1101192 RepID=UPI0012DD547C|nr:hypothetical protein [Methylobacterium sp. 77]